MPRVDLPVAHGCSVQGVGGGFFQRNNMTKTMFSKFLCCNTVIYFQDATPIDIAQKPTTILLLNPSICLSYTLTLLLGFKITLFYISPS